MGVNGTPQIGCTLIIIGLAIFPFTVNCIFPPALDSILQFPFKSQREDLPSCCGDGDSCNGNRCNWEPWCAWGSCSQKVCGPGIQRRQRCLCCPAGTDLDGCLSECNKDRDDFLDSRSCCGQSCPGIKFCQTYNDVCKAEKATCDVCENRSAQYDAYHLFPPNTVNNECRHKCNWLGHWCWPGVCSGPNYYPSTCQCMEPDFQRYTVGEYETKCRLLTKPYIETCLMGIADIHDNIANTTWVGATSSCDNTIDKFVNFRNPTELYVDFKFAFALSKSLPSKPPYIAGEVFGIVGGNVKVQHHKKSGQKVLVTNVNVQGMCNTPLSPDSPWDKLVSCDVNSNIQGSLSVNDGDLICQELEPVGSGVVDVKDLVKQTQSRHRYEQTTILETKCFHFDFTPASHCAPGCSDEPLDVGQRVQNHSAITAVYRGWFDPDPNSAVSGPSEIEKYKIDIHTTQHDHGKEEIFVNMKVEATYETEHNVQSNTFNLPELDVPMLFAIYLTTLDNAGNFKFSRRFVLYDKTSEIETDHTKGVKALTANPGTNYKWQLSHDTMLVDWKGYFHNSWHRHSNFLWPIRTYTNISGIYDQETGTLPVYGTTNVDGITVFYYSYHKYSPTEDVSNDPTPISNVLDEQISLDSLSLYDGDTVDVTVKAEDISGNTLSESIRVFIDASPPELDLNGLCKNDECSLFVHSSIDLVSMDFRFESYDPHSGLNQVYWKLGTKPQLDDIGHAALPVHRINGTEACLDPVSCYCPILDDCAYINYTIPLNHLIESNTSIGTHNRQYHFHIEVINRAHLKSEAEMVILVDDSPPEAGVVIDGPQGSPDRDFQSDSLLQWHWRSFVDHESGIRKYHYAMADACMKLEDLEFLDGLNDSAIEFGETEDSFLSYEVDEPGFYVLSVIAFNNALDPSDVSCSDGVLYDTTPPIIQHVQLTNGHTQPSVACFNETLWYVSEKRIASVVDDDDFLCSHHCNQEQDISLLLVNVSLINGTFAPGIQLKADLCNYLPGYEERQYIFLPSDNIDLGWEFLEDESQMHDFYLGISSSEENIYEPDIIGFHSTHNRTHYKCVHCGPGEGERFFIVLKGVNKGGLEHIVSIGPVVIDFTPPVYDDGIAVEVANNLLFSWQASTFYDGEDEDLLSHYEWSIGSASDPTLVTDWRLHLFNISDLNSVYEFSVEYNASILQHHDQDRGLEYLFYVKAFNRAGHSTVGSSSPFTVHSHALPSSGIIYHVMEGNEGIEIGFQEDHNVLCAKWVDFSHHKGDINFALGVGFSPYSDDIIPLTNINETSSFCFYNLDLQTMQKYYFVISAFNVQGETRVTSKGLFVAEKSNVFLNSKINDGVGCSNDFIHEISDVTIGALGSNPITFTLPDTLQFGFYSLAIDYPWTNELQQLIITTDNQQISQQSWKFLGNFVRSYYTIPILSQNQTLVVNCFSAEDVTLSQITMDPCLQDIRIQGSSKGLWSSWTFLPEVQRSVSRYQITFHEFTCTENGCTDEEQISPMLYTSSEEPVFYPKSDMIQGRVYKAQVAPCFGNTCLESRSSSGVLLNSKHILSSNMGASIITYKDGGILNMTEGIEYKITSSWDAFVPAFHGSESLSAKLYQWSIALSPHGSGLLIDWKSIFTPSSDKIEDTIVSTLQMHQSRTVYLVVRGVLPGHMISLHSVAAEFDDLRAPLAAQVYDLDPDYEDFDEIKDYLHSQQLGWLAKKLHNEDVDFTSDTARINGALRGSDCSSHLWWIQTNAKKNCKEERTSSCIQSRTTSENIVRMRYLRLTHATRYFLCVYVSGDNCQPFRVCSNGFVVDTRPPLPGMVTTAGPSHADNTSIAIEWEGFTDVEEEVDLPCSHGIKDYQYAIGSSAGDVNTIPFTSVGLVQQKSITNLSLVSGKLYFVTIKACDHVSLCTQSSTPPIMVDATPPVAGKVIVNLLNIRPASEEDLLVTWDGFADDDSGISGYEVGIGTTVHSQDVVLFQPVTGQVQTFIGNRILSDGVIYYFHVKATNGAGLSTISTSLSLKYDSSAPTKGFVRIHNARSKGTHVYSTHTGGINVTWGGFTDPQTGIAFYRFCVGSQSAQCDVLAWEEVGLHTDVYRPLSMSQGKPYHVTVEACNGVLLCTKVRAPSLIIDNSPPLPGVIMVGHGEGHEPYISSRTFLSLSWVSFHDPQSNIEEYQWCISTVQSTCDVWPVTSAHQSLRVFMSNLDLPENIQLFIDLIAINKVGLSCMARSSNFVIDTTPPSMVGSPKFKGSLSLVQGTQFDRSLVELEWLFQDDISPVWNHVISVTTHFDGAIPVDSMIVGDVKSVTVPLVGIQQLKDGNRYVANVIACNAAKLCTHAETPEILVDSSAPHVGGFIEPLTWANMDQGSLLNLSWTGFDDAHSGIHAYYIMISTTYNGADLSGGVLRLDHKDNQDIQENTVTTKQKIQPYTTIYLTIWAENGVGLISDAAKASVFILDAHPSQSFGRLDIQKHSCDIHYCNKDCTCAVVNAKCADPTDVEIPDCDRIKTKNSSLSVRNGLGHEISITASSTCLTGFWSKNDDTEFTRFEWTVGATNAEPGFPIFDPNKEKYWFDVELNNRTIYCLPGNRSLVQGTSYVVYINGWMDFSQYAQYVSQGVKVDTTAPRVGMGRRVKIMDANFTKELTHSSVTNVIHIDWDRVFSDAETGIHKYELAVGTTEAGNEIYGPDDVELNIRASISDIVLQPGLVYYATVHAYNPLGLVTSFTSQGVVIDIEPPLPGIVYTSATFQDTYIYGDFIQASWVGFNDLHSFIDHYEWAIDKDVNEDSLAFQSSMLETEVTYPTDDLIEGIEYFIYVRAIDAAGFSSSVMKSNSIIVDRHKPEIIHCDQFETIDEEWLFTCEDLEVSGQKICKLHNTIVVHHYKMYQISLFSNTNIDDFQGRLQLDEQWDWIHFIRINANLFIHRSTILSMNEKEVSPKVYIMKGNLDSITVKVERCLDKQKTRSFQGNQTMIMHQVGTGLLSLSWTVSSVNSPIASQKIGLGTTPGGFQLQPLTEVGFTSTVSLPLKLSHRMKVYAVLVVQKQSGIQSSYHSGPLLIDWTGPHLSDLEVDIHKEGERTMSLTATWNVEEEESEVQDCKWSIGNLPRSDNILRCSGTDSISSSHASSLSLQHGDQIFVTITCTNSLGLSKTISSQGQWVISKPPNTDNAYINIYPMQSEVFHPRDDTQSNTEDMEFAFHGFDDQVDIKEYQYRIEGLSDTTWASVDLSDHITLNDLSLKPNRDYDICVRARNWADYYSDQVSAKLYVNTNAPRITGKLEYHLLDSVLTLDWSSMFSFDAKIGSLEYVVNVGTSEGSGNLVTGRRTFEDKMEVTSKLLAEPPVECFVHITAVAPHGGHTTHYQTLLL